jgi:uncharacterized repeat protein (TIGR03803 family)
MRASDGFFYGTTQGGGANDLGTIFQVDAAGALTVVHDFAAGDGRQPPSDLLDGETATFTASTASAPMRTTGRSSA